jgi:biotin carboxylase
MNFVFISPHFPHTYWEFCNRLKQNGVNVLGIADVPYEELSFQLKQSLTEYYRVHNLENYDEVYRAVAFLAFKYGRIDWIESNNEYWLEQDARLRTDFHVTTGLQADEVWAIRKKSAMKEFYAKGGIPTARQIQCSEGIEAVREFIKSVGYPVIGKPNVGVGAGGTHKIGNEDDLQRLFSIGAAINQYVVEEFVTGDICSYDAIIDSHSQPLFESMTVWPPSIMDIVNRQLDLSYYVTPTMPEQLRSLGRRTVEAFRVKSRFVHLEFFRLDRDREGLGKEGDFVALEVNMRPAGGYTPDMINYAHSTDVYRIWADMVAYDKSQAASSNQHDTGNALSIPWSTEYYCCFASRRDIHHYRHTDDEVRQRYQQQMVMSERMPDILSGAMGQQMFTVRLKTHEEVEEFVNFVHEKVNEE